MAVDEIRHKRIQKLLTQTAAAFYDRFKLSNRLRDVLLSEGVISRDEVNRLDARNINPDDMAHIILDKVKAKGVPAFVNFCRVLCQEDIDQSYIVTKVWGLNRKDSIESQLDAMETADKCDSGSTGAEEGGKDVPLPVPAQAMQDVLLPVPPQAMQDVPLPVPPQAMQDVPQPVPPQAMQDDIPELTDEWDAEPVTVHQTTEEFYKDHCDPRNVYQMYERPRGLCLIINVGNVKGKKPRRGTIHDSTKLKSLVEGLHLKSILYSDLCASDILAKVKEFFEMPEHGQANCAMMCIMSHGSQNTILGADGEPVILKVLYGYMERCTMLNKKPKLVFIQACGGGGLDEGRMTVNPPDVEEEETDDKLAHMVDMFIGRPSLPGKVSYRNPSSGSWYIQAIVKVFSQFAATNDLLSLMTKVNKAVARRESKDGCKQMPDQRNYLTKGLYFNPGI